MQKDPSLDRNWSEESKVLPDVTISENEINVKNLRDWRYASDTIVTKSYYNETFNLNRIENVYFLISPFGESKHAAHTFFTFEFSDGKSVSVSVEARREAGDEYSTLKGALNNYELWYTWGSAADFYTRRAVNFGDRLYKYPLLVSTTTARALLVDLAKTTEKLETEPQFYNTVLTNCTNVLADAANRISPGSIPWNWAHIYTGFADDKLYELKLIPHNKPFEDIEKEARIDEIIKEQSVYASQVHRDIFWRRLMSAIE
jgi:hypothetical protein